MTRQYGTTPFRAAVLHGGPGGIGSAGGLAEALGSRRGILEPFQSKRSIAELLEELHGQLAPSPAPLALIGHSWGAWLAALYAVEHPERVSRLILIGCAPWQAKFVPRIMERRFARMNEKQRERFAFLERELKRGGNSEQLQELGNLCSATDNFAPIENLADPPSSFDGDMHTRIWNEAAAMRASGELTRRIARLTRPLTVIHGDSDPHPPEGVTEFLQNTGIPFTYHLLPRCGHTPWREEFARNACLEILFTIL